MRLWNTIKHDIAFQYRHGFYYVYAVLSVIYILSLYPLNTELKNIITTLVLFTDVGMIGFFFIGAIVILEKGQNLLECIFVTPLRLSEYLFSKVVSLSFLALLSALCITVSVHGFSISLLFFIPGMAFSTAFYTLFGIWVAVRSKNVNDYFAKAIGLGLLLSLPVFGLLGLFNTPVFNIFPAHASIILFESVYKPQSMSSLLFAYLIIGLWTLFAAVLVRKDFKGYILRQMGTK